MKNTNQSNMTAEIEGLARRHGINISSSAIDEFVATTGVRELHAAELSPVVGGARPNPTPEQCTKFFTYPTTTTVPGSISGGTIRWTVPLAAVGSPTTGDGLYGITGFTASGRALRAISGASAVSCSERACSR